MKTDQPEARVKPTIPQQVPAIPKPIPQPIPQQPMLRQELVRQQKKRSERQEAKAPPSTLDYLRREQLMKVGEDAIPQPVVTPVKSKETPEERSRKIAKFYKDKEGSPTVRTRVPVPPVDIGPVNRGPTVRTRVPVQRVKKTDVKEEIAKVRRNLENILHESDNPIIEQPTVRTRTPVPIVKQPGIDEVAIIDQIPKVSTSPIRPRRRGPLITNVNEDDQKLNIDPPRGGDDPDSPKGPGRDPRRPPGPPSGPPSGPPAPNPPTGVSKDDLKKYYMKMMQFGYKVPIQYQQHTVIMGPGGGGASSSAAASGAGACSSGSGAAKQTDEELKRTMRKILEALQKKKGTAKKSSLDAVAKKQLSAKKKEYNAVRKNKIKNLTILQKNELATVKQQIASLPRGKRASEGKRIRAAIRDKYTKLKQRIPTTAKKSLGEIVSLIKGIKTLKV